MAICKPIFAWMRVNMKLDVEFSDEALLVMFIMHCLTNGPLSSITKNAEQGFGGIPPNKREKGMKVADYCKIWNAVHKLANVNNMGGIIDSLESAIYNTNFNTFIPEGKAQKVTWLIDDDLLRCVSTPHRIYSPPRRPASQKLKTYTCTMVV